MTSAWSRYARFTPRAAIALGLLWAAFCAWCVRGFPPAVDLPAHAAQIETLADVLRHRPAARYYTWHVPLGYGLTTWLGVPLAVLWNGATAARVLLWLSVVLFPLAQASLARALGRSGWIAVFSAPCAFGVSYWFGFLPTLFAWPFVLWGWALFVRVRGREHPRWRDWAALWALSLWVMQIHLLAFAAFSVGIAALAFPTPRVRAWRRSFEQVALTLAPGFALCTARVLVFARRAAHPSGASPFSYGLAAHFNWTLWHYGPDQRVAAWATALTACAFAAVALRSPNAKASREALVLTFALLLLYFATPLALSGAWAVHARFPVLIVAALFLIGDVELSPRVVQLPALGLTALALSAVAHFHVDFSRSISGLDPLIAAPAPSGPTDGMSLVGLTLPHERIKFLEHLPQWWTATEGGVGSHLFADADHQAVQFKEGVRLPALLTPSVGAVGAFQSLLIFGEGPLPNSLSAFHEVARAGHWRRVDRGR